MKLSTKEILNKYSKDSSHPDEVMKLSEMIFDETSKKVHELKSKHKEYLKAASLLHDIGYYIDSKGHNKHSMKMIIKEGLSGFDDRETAIIACICRYHRGSLPDKEEHEVYNTFDKKERKIVKRLAGILRIADGLDIGHQNQITKIEINYDSENNIVEFMITPKIREFLPDISNAIQKRDLYEVAFKCQTVFKFS